jgi:hypothetical protein
MTRLTGFVRWACLDLNQGPLPYQFWHRPSSGVSTSPPLEVTVNLMGWLCGPIAVVRDGSPSLEGCD